ncbi:pyruvate kinase [Marinicella litoralis]|uniref:Pyruvate kinase n=1 Tax=Marinicella litoralis TaxID=644220 RepID=A0A4R6XRV2_9GAMM|nr:pyruvate kinase [Marinicella litoralis]TDR20744.1 pyruvate kinase [Marinicella litoralis]
MKRKTKIVATLGPASQAPEQIEALIKAGVNVFRLNFSHGTADNHKTNVANIRAVAAKLNVLVGILQDLQGPKIRVGAFINQSILLAEGQPFALYPDNNKMGDDAGVGISYKDLYKDLAIGDSLLLDDGKLELKVTKIADDIIHTQVYRGGLLSNMKGINVPGADLSIAAVTEKDIEDIAVGAQLDVDWVALSFVRNRDDLLLAKKYLNQNKSNAKLMAKIEKPGAIKNYKEILNTADGIMVARGDLGVELSPEKVPMLQKRLIRKAREKGKPVVTATQMLETMTENAIPTRAEANDVANAIFDGTDAVMLSAETATGKYPVIAVETMDRIARTVEADSDYKKRMQDRKFKAEKNTPDAVSYAACHIATTLAAEVMCCFSSSGATALRVARNRIHTDVIAISPSSKSCHQLTVSWGINPVLSDDATSTDEMVDIANQVIIDNKMAQSGDQFVITAGVPFGYSGTTNLIRVETLK